MSCTIERVRVSIRHVIFCCEKKFQDLKTRRSAKPLASRVWTNARSCGAHARRRKENVNKRTNKNRIKRVLKKLMFSQVLPYVVVALTTLGWRRERDENLTYYYNAMSSLARQNHNV